MLSEASLAQQCEIYGVLVDPALDKPKLIAKLAARLRELDNGRLLGDVTGGAGAAEVDAAGIDQVEDHELPSNLWSLEKEQLQAVCAGYNIEVRCAWRFRHRTPGNDWRFPFKLPKTGADTSKRTYIENPTSCATWNLSDRCARRVIAVTRPPRRGHSTTRQTRRRT
jgi:hypothetical protein